MCVFFFHGCFVQKEKRGFSGGTGMMGFVSELLLLILKVMKHWISAKEEEKYFLSTKQTGLQI